MAYNPNIPQPTDLLSVSQNDLLNNFQALQTLIDVNHVDFASVDQGKHKWVTFPVQGAAPVFAAGEVGIFNLANALTGNNELNITNSVGTTTAFTASAQTSSGWTYLPSGILLKWGNNATVPGANTITFPVAGNIPVFNNVFQVMVTTKGIVGANVFVQLVSFTQLNMLVDSTERTTLNTSVSAFTWLAIGN